MTGKDMNTVVTELVNATTADILLELEIKARNASCEVPLECLKMVREIVDEKIKIKEKYEKYIAILK